MTILTPPSNDPAGTREITVRKRRGFSLVELLTVIAIIAILSAIAAPLIPGLLRGNQMDSDVSTLSGILEQARETATANNTYVWVAFTDAPVTSPVGTWVATFQSVDGTESPVNTAIIPAWTSTGLTIPGGNLSLTAKIQNLPGATFVDGNSSSTSPTPSAAYNTLAQKAPSGSTYLFEKGAPIPATPFTQPSVQWTVTPLQNTSLGTGVYFQHVIEFTPDGEAHVPTWASNMQFGLIPSLTSSTSPNNIVLFNISRLTGRTTVYRQ